MKALIKDLKKHDAFRFKDQIFIVHKKHRNEDSPLITTCGEWFYFDELEIEKIDKKALGL